MMDQISVHDILLHYGKWIESSKFISLIKGRRDVGDRRAYQLIKEAYESRNEETRIYEHIFPDRVVWYGLPEFGPPTWHKEEIEKLDEEEIKTIHDDLEYDQHFGH